MYTPGSFSKNYGWHGDGFSKLHLAIRTGFQKKVTPISRKLWREHTHIDDREGHLIPLNFFLHNKEDRVSTDELVYRAVHHSHSLNFDRLALFAFHLNRVGSPPRNGPERPAMWANEFVRERLWLNGHWQTSALLVEEMDKFIGSRLEAISADKCRSNYRHFFELADYLPAETSTINTKANEWINSAVFLTWDRFLLDGGDLNKDSLLSCLVDNEIYKLLGINETSFMHYVQNLSDTYIDAGGTERLENKSTEFVDLSGDGLTVEIEWDDIDSYDETVERKTVQRQQQLRDKKKALGIKKTYQDRCMFCGIQLQIGKGEYYSEAAHIKPLGEPHNGPDKTSNIIVLCPNHHKQLDRGILRMQAMNNKIVIVSCVENDPLNGKEIELKHEIGEEYIQWHYSWFSSRR